jgi:hypothetical protein
LLLGYAAHKKLKNLQFLHQGGRIVLQIDLLDDDLLFCHWTSAKENLALS